jgi:hypothetical protein
MLWTVGGVVVRPAGSAAPLNIALNGSVGTIHTFEVSGATAGAVYTVTSEAGVLTTADVDTRLAGTQVQAAGSSFTFTLDYNTASGAINLAAREVTGAAFGSGSLSPLTSADGMGSGEDLSLLTAAELDMIRSAAIARWAAVGLTDAQISLLETVELQIGDLGSQLGLASGSLIVIDDDGAGWGWFIDATPWDDSEFDSTAGTLTAGTSSEAAGRMDLLTVVLHELGHRLGLLDLSDASSEDALMHWALGTGTRRVPDATDAYFAALGE